MTSLNAANGEVESGGCLDRCPGCQHAFGQVPKEDVHQLTPRQTKKEAEYVVGSGAGVVQFLSATVRTMLDSKNVAKHVRAVVEAGAWCMVNVFPFASQDDYKRLADAGAAGVIVSQETYDLALGRRLFAGGPKANLERRLNALNLACEAGIKTVGLGFWGGLSSNHVFEALCVIAHAYDLQGRTFPNVIPLFYRNIGGEQDASLYMAPDFLRFLGCVYSLAIFRSVPFLYTNEDPALTAK